MAWIVAVIVSPVLLLLSISVPVYHSWQLLVVKSSIQTVERAGLLDQLSGRGNDVANQSGIISVASNFLTLSGPPCHSALSQVSVREVFCNSTCLSN